MSRGHFITFEGIDGAGKSTLLSAVLAALQAQGFDPLSTREPGGTPLAERVRALLLHEPMQSTTETLLMFAARHEHVQAVIEPALQAGRWVVCDRYTDATYAYQCGGRGVSEAAIDWLAQWTHPATRPDLTVLVDLPPALAARRLAVARSADRFESEQQAFFERVRDRYLLQARREPQRMLLIDGQLPTHMQLPQVMARLSTLGQVVPGQSR